MKRLSIYIFTIFSVKNEVVLLSKQTLTSDVLFSQMEVESVTLKLKWYGVVCVFCNIVLEMFENYLAIGENKNSVALGYDLSITRDKPMSTWARNFAKWPHELQKSIWSVVSRSISCPKCNLLSKNEVKLQPACSETLIMAMLDKSSGTLILLFPVPYVLNVNHSD